MLLSRSARIMPNPLDTREIFYTNLLLLNFDAVAMESREKIPFNRDMFALPNKKAMEVVMYFLLSKLNPQMAFEQFRDCWPVRNKVDEQKFRKTCYDWVSKLAKEDSDTHFPRVVQSTFHSPGGDKFYKFLLSFSTYVLKVVMHRDHSLHVPVPPFPSKTIHNKAFTQVISKSLQIQTSLHRKRFLERTKYSLDLQQQWKTYAMELNKEHRSLKKKKKELEKHLQKDTSSRGDQMAKSIAASSDYQKEVDTLQRTQQLQKIRALWKAVEDFYLEYKPEVVESILSNQANLHHLDAADVDVKIPDLLLRELERDVHMRRVSNTYIGGKLNLLSLVQLWNLSVNIVKEKLQQESVPGFDEISPKIKNEVHGHQSMLTNAEYSRLSLSKDTIPDLKKSIEHLKTAIYSQIHGIELAGLNAFNVSLGLVPPTPPVSFKAAGTPASQRITSFQESLKRSPVAVSTPDVISAWSESLVGRRPPVHSQKTNLSKPSQQDKNKKKESMEPPTQIPKPKTISTGFTRNYYKTGHEKHHKTLPKKTTISSTKRQVTTTKVKDNTISPLAVDYGRKGIESKPRRVTAKGNLKMSATDEIANQIIGSLTVDKPDSGSSTQSSRSSTPKPQAIDDPMEALDETAFVSRDLLSRTPALRSFHGMHSGEEDTPRRHMIDLTDKETPRGNVNDSGGLLETILSHSTDKSLCKTVRTSLFLSPDDQPHHDDSFTEETRDSSRHDLLPPFAFSGPDNFDEKSYNPVNLLTPFAFATPHSPQNSFTKGIVDNGSIPLTSKAGVDSDVMGKLIQFTPMDKKLTQEVISTKIPNDEWMVGLTPAKTPSSTLSTLKETLQAQTSTETPERLISFTPLADKMPGSSMKETDPPKADNPAQFTPMAQQISDASSRTFDDLQSPFMLSKLFEDQLSLSNKKLAMGSPVSRAMPSNSYSSLDHDKTVTHSISSTSMPGDGKANIFEPTVINGDKELRTDAESTKPNISVYEPTVINEDKEWRTDAESTKYQTKTSPFGVLDVSDDGELHNIPTSKPPTGDVTASFKGMQESDLMTRLNRIKAAQRFDYKYQSPSPDTGRVKPGNEHHDIAMETIQANQLDQIKEAQQEGALLTPLTISSAGSPENGSTDNQPKFSYDINNKSATSNLSTPSSMLSERYIIESPHRLEKDDIFLSLDSPLLPSSGTNGLSLLEMEEEHNSAKGHDIVGSSLGVELDTSLSKHIQDNGHSPIPSLLRSSGKTAWAPSDEDITKLQDKRYSFDNFLDESIDTSFLVQATPRREPSRDKPMSD